MPNPEGNLVTPIGIDAAGNLWALLVDAAGRLQVDVIAMPAMALTIADGADVTQGALADAVVAAGAAGSISAKLRRLTTDLDALLTELGLKADLTDTQPVSAAALPLPLGAATSAKQGTMELDIEAIVTALAGGLPVALDGLSLKVKEQGADLDIRDIDEAQDDILVYGADVGGTNRKLRTDAVGRLEVITAMQTTAKARAYLSADQSINNNTLTDIAFNAETYDPGANFDTAANKFVAPVAGYYVVTFSAIWAAADVVSGIEILARVKVGGTAVADFFGTTGATEIAQSMPIPDVIHLNVDDEVTVDVRHKFGAASDLLGGSAYTWISLHLISAD